MKRLNRFISNFDLGSDKISITDFALIHQMRNVLHLDVGESVVLCDGKGREVIAKLNFVTKGEANFTREGELKVASESPRKVTLYSAVLKNENFELVSQKATECGVARIVPIITERTIKMNLRMDRLTKIVREASEQSGRVFLPEISEPMVLDDALLDSKNNEANLFFDMSGKGIKEAVLETRHTVGAFVGPEGGWSDAEVQKAKDAGLDIVSLGTLVLRGETAAVVATYLVVNG